MQPIVVQQELKDSRSTEFKIIVSLWVNFIIAVVFYFSIAVLPVGVMLSVAFLLTCGAHYLHFSSPAAPLNRYAYTVILVYYFSYFVYGSSGQESMHFHYAFTMTILALYHDWKVILAISVLYAVHHMAFVIFEPGLIFSHSIKENAQFGPWMTFVLHAIAVVITALPLMLGNFWSVKKKKELENFGLQMEILLQEAQANNEKKTVISNEILSSLSLLKRNSSEIGNIFLEIENAVKEVSLGTEFESGTLGKISNAVSAMTENVSQMSQNTNEIREKTDYVSREVSEGLKKIHTLVSSIEKLDQVMKNARAVISELENQNKEIASIVTTITGISSQTNLLALNAAIEAARAGEYGRGFSVVAQEIGKLASQSALSANQIVGIIANTQKQIKTVVEEVQKGQSAMSVIHSYSGESEKAFQHINSSIQSLYEEVRKIDSGAAGLNAESGNIAGQISDISARLEETSASVSEILANTVSQNRNLGSNLSSIEKIELNANRLV